MKRKLLLVPFTMLIISCAKVNHDYMAEWIHPFGLQTRFKTIQSYDSVFKVFPYCHGNPDSYLKDFYPFLEEHKEFDYYIKIAQYDNEDTIISSQYVHLIDYPNKDIYSLYHKEPEKFDPSKIENGFRAYLYINYNFNDILDTDGYLIFSIVLYSDNNEEINYLNIKEWGLTKPDVTPMMGDRQRVLFSKNNGKVHLTYKSSLYMKSYSEDKAIDITNLK